MNLGSNSTPKANLEVDDCSSPYKESMFPFYFRCETLNRKCFLALFAKRCEDQYV
ncbi:hypothetical protein RND71_017808 [Anisodus tanguticus]|uniref:Uncharacterized protein n=1 Tax=Anisodus tanguticus TaxID=243964 RepID=A0AAE1S4G2_9SOLA|nr:hypothetical protein RND71_017808 [Anisodus tanguticus]